MKTILIVFLFSSLSGCKILPEINKETEVKSGKLRIEIFKQCMELAANVSKATTQHHNDLGELVSECSQQSYYMAKHATR